MLTFNGLGRDLDTEPVSLVYKNRCDALFEFEEITKALKEKYPGHPWFDDTDKRKDTKKIAYRLESQADPRIMVETHRIKFLTGPVLWCKENLNQDEIALYAKGVNI